MSAEAPQTDGGTQHDDLAGRHDGVAATREELAGTFEYEVVIPTEKLEELSDAAMTAAEFAENIATSRLNSELDPTFSVKSGSAMAKEEENYICNGERRFTVWVRFDQSD